MKVRGARSGIGATVTDDPRLNPAQTLRASYRAARPLASLRHVPQQPIQETDHTDHRADRAHHSQRLAVDRLCQLHLHLARLDLDLLELHPNVLHVQTHLLDFLLQVQFGFAQLGLGSRLFQRRVDSFGLREGIRNYPRRGFIVPRFSQLFVER